MTHWNYVEIMILATQPTMVLPALYLVKRYLETRVNEFLMWSLLFFQITLNGIFEIGIDLLIHGVIQESVIAFIILGNVKYVNLRLLNLTIILIAGRWMVNDSRIRKIIYGYSFIILGLLIFDLLLGNSFYRVIFDNPNWISNQLSEMAFIRFDGLTYREKLAAGQIGLGIFDFLTHVFYLELIRNLTFTFLLFKTRRDVLPDLKAPFNIWLGIMVFTTSYTMLGLLRSEGVFEITTDEQSLLYNSIQITFTVLSNFTILFLLFKYPKALVATRAMEERVRELYAKLNIVKSESTPNLNEFIDYLEVAEEQRSTD